MAAQPGVPPHAVQGLVYLSSEWGMDLRRLPAVVVLLAVMWASAAALRWVWWLPMWLERALGQQGIDGNPYRPLVSDMWELARLNREARSRPMPAATSHDIAPRVCPLVHQSIAKHGFV